MSVSLAWRRASSAGRFLSHDRVFPFPLREDAHISGHYEVRREVRPGMTGPWQVLGRSDIPFDDMLKLDYSYVVNWSFIEDLRFLLHTVSAVIRARGAY